MIRALSGALSLALVIVVLRMALPEIAGPLVEIIVKVLALFNTGLDFAASQSTI